MVTSPVELSGSNCEVEPKTRCVPSPDIGRPTKPAVVAVCPGSFEPAIPWTRLPSGRWTGIPVLPSAKHGSQMLPPPKAKVERPSSACSSGEPKGGEEGALSAGIPTYVVDQPFSPRVA